MTNRIKLRTEKNGIMRASRGKRGTRDHIYVLNSLIGNELKYKKGKLYLVLVEYKTAFEMVNNYCLES